MKLNRVFAQGFKGRDFDTELQAVNIIAGPNFAGKTARLDAIQLALAGYHPRLPKRNADIMDLATGASMTVGVGTDTGDIVRSWALKKGAASRTDNLKAKDLTEIPAVLIDSALYFGATDRERVNMAFACADLSKAEITPATLRAKIKAIRLPDHNEHHEHALTALAAMVSDRSPEQTVQEWLDELLEAMKLQATETKAAAARMQGTVAGMTEIQAGIAPAALTTEAELNAARAARDAAYNTAAAIQLAVNQRNTDAARIEEINAALAGAATRHAENESLKLQVGGLHDRLTTESIEFNKKAAELEGVKKEIARARAAVTELEKALDAARLNQIKTNAVKEDWQAETKAAADAAHKADTLEKGLNPNAATERDAAKKEHQAAQEAASKATTARTLAAERLNKAMTDAAKLDGLTECPYCTAHEPGWKQRVQAKAKEETARISKELEQLLIASEQAEAIEIAARKQATDYAERYERDFAAKKTIVDLRLQAQKSTELAKRYEAIHADLVAQKTPAQIETDIVRANMALTAAQNTLAGYETPEYRNAEERMFEMEQQLSAIETKQIDLAEDAKLDEALAAEALKLRAKPAPSDEELARAQKAVAEAETAARQAQDDYTTSTAARTRAASQAQAKLEADAATAEATATAEALRLMQEAKEIMVEATFGRILKTANRIARILKTPLEYRDGVVGRFEGSTFISHKTFSGTEQAVTHAAISIALAAESPLKIVLIDELGRLDAGNKKRLLEGVIELVEDGTIDQFVGVDTEASAYTGIEEINVIALP